MKLLTFHYLFFTDQVEFTPTDTEHEYQPEWRPLSQVGDLFWPDQKDLVEEKRELIQHALAPYLHKEVQYAVQ